MSKASRLFSCLKGTIRLHAEIERLKAELEKSQSRVDALEKELEVGADTEIERDQLRHELQALTLHRKLMIAEHTQDLEGLNEELKKTHAALDAANKRANLKIFEQPPFHVRVREWFRKRRSE